MGTVIYDIWLIIQGITAFILVFPLLSYLVFLWAGKRKVSPALTGINPDYGIIVTAYGYAGNLKNVIASLLQQSYPQFIIYVVADNCGEGEIYPPHEKLVIIKPETVLANQLKSHVLAITHFKRQHTIVTIIDSDNLVAPNYLEALNPWFKEGYQAVQGVRKAKNTNTAYASVDALNELYYLFYDRMVLFAIGSSAMLSGSGMAFTTALYKSFLDKTKSSGAGFDKILQKEILYNKYRIAFAGEAIVYDEKTDNADQLVKQRARWNNTWFRYVRFGFTIFGQGLKNFSLNQLLFGFVLLRPPLFLLLLLSGSFFLINLFTNSLFAWAWVICFLLFILAFFIALANTGADKNLYKSIIHIPRFISMQILSLTKAAKANKVSVATKHSVTTGLEEIKK